MELQVWDNKAPELNWSEHHNQYFSIQNAQLTVLYNNIKSPFLELSLNPGINARLKVWNIKI